MIKVIQDNKVIDVVKYPKYVKFLSPKRIAMTNKALAQGVVGSDGTKIYSYAPVESKTAGVVTVAEICQEEYDRLSALLFADETVSADEVSLAKAKEALIRKLSESCNKAITAGFTVKLSSGDTHDFKLTTEDQLNLLMLENQLNTGARTFVYHATNKPCEVFSKKDMTKILAAFRRHILYHTTYFNAAKQYIKAQVDIEKVLTFEYGIDISDKVADSNIRQILRTGGKIL